MFENKIVVRHELSREFVVDGGVASVEMVKQNLSRQMAEDLMFKYSDSLKETINNRNNTLKYELELIVFTPEELQTFIRAVKNDLI